MRMTRDDIMGMPITVAVVGVGHPVQEAIASTFRYFIEIDHRFSTYKHGSEISRINRQEIRKEDHSPEMQEIFALAQKTTEETQGYFDMTTPDGSIDPSGVVKGWAIHKAAQELVGQGYANCYIDAGGDIQAHGFDEEGKPWSVGIRNPFRQDEIVKVIYPGECGVATSGSYARGAHIYNPHDHAVPVDTIVSLTLIGPDICEADRFATAAFAMGSEGAAFIETLPGFEGYAIGRNGIATMTTGFASYTHPLS